MLVRVMLSGIYFKCLTRVVLRTDLVVGCTTFYDVGVERWERYVPLFEYEDVSVGWLVGGLVVRRSGDGFEFEAPIKISP